MGSITYSYNLPIASLHAYRRADVMELESLLIYKHTDTVLRLRP